MKKKLLYKALLFIFILVIIINLARPKIIDHFACSDYCPGGTESYTVQIYEGVENKIYCLVLGGYPTTYHGWGKLNICEVRKLFSK